MEFRALSLISILLLGGCMASYNKPYYKDQWSKAKNLGYAAGMEEKLYDQELPKTAYDKNGKLLEDKLDSIFHHAYGSSGKATDDNISKATDDNISPFDRFYWGWTIPGVSHHHEHRVFAWMPLNMASDIVSAKHVMESMLSRASLSILKEMNYSYQAIKNPFMHKGIKFKQWYLGHKDGSCSLQKMNCVLSIYVAEPTGPCLAPYFAFKNIAGEASWFFAAKDNSTFPRLILAEGDGTKSINANTFYQKLSARLPGWLYFYIAPNQAGIGDNNRTVPYPYVLEKGKPLLFIRPVNK